MSTTIVVFESSDYGAFSMAQSVLRAHGIEFEATGELLQDLIGGGRLGGVNIAVGPARLAVSPERADAARELLADLEHRR